MLIPMFLIIGIWGGPNRIYAAVKFFLYSVVAVLVIAALGALLLGLAPGPLFDWAGRALIP